MNTEFEDASRWPVSRYFRELVASQPDGRVLIVAAKLNVAAGLLAALSLMFWPLSQDLAWVHVVFFLGMPLAGFVWFFKGMPPPTLRAIEQACREPWERVASVQLQVFAAVLPWFTVLGSHVH